MGNSSRRCFLSTALAAGATVAATGSVAASSPEHPWLTIRQLSKELSAALARAVDAGETPTLMLIRPEGTPWAVVSAAMEAWDEDHAEMVEALEARRIDERLTPKQRFMSRFAGLADAMDDIAEGSPGWKVFAGKDVSDGHTWFTRYRVDLVDEPVTVRDLGNRRVSPLATVKVERMTDLDCQELLT